MTISQPSAPTGDKFEPSAFQGALLLIYPKNFVAEAVTKVNTTAQADADVIVVDRVDATGQPQVFHNARLFGNLAKSVSRDIGGAVLGRLGQGPNTKGNPPWILTPFSDQDLAAATPLDVAYRQGQFRPTENPMAGQQPPQQQPPAQQYQAPPPQQQYQTPAPQAAPAYAQQAPPTAPPQQQYAPPPQQQYQAPPQQQYAAPAPTGQPAAPAPAPAGAGGADPALLARLAQHGINLPPETTQAQAEAVAATLPQ